MQPTWNILNKQWVKTHSGLQNVISSVDWICYRLESAANEQEHFIKITGNFNLTPPIDTSAFIDYANVTNATIFEWLDAQGLNRIKITNEVDKLFNEQYAN